MCKMMQELRAEGYNEGWAGGWSGGMAEGIAKGMAGGEAKKARETAYKLAGRGDPPEEIADMVGYDVQTVKVWMEEREMPLS